MDTRFEIFQMEPNGGLLWSGKAENADAALETVHEFGKTSPGKYMIINLVTWRGVVVVSDGTGIASAATPSLNAQGTRSWNVRIRRASRDRSENE
jgi:hypothetical protein